MTTQDSMERNQAFSKISKYCSYRDRCHKEVRAKLLSWGVYGDMLEDLMGQLIRDNFLNEERFARSFARGKHRLKQWGRVRIESELRLRDVSDYCIRKAMEEIDQDDYIEALSTICRKYYSARKDRYDPILLYRKTYQYLINKGYEPSLVSGILRKLTNTG